jgi:hypothetical protein
VVVPDIQHQLGVSCSEPPVSDFVLILWVTWYQFQNPLISTEAIEIHRMWLLNQRGIGRKAERLILGVELGNFGVKLDDEIWLFCFLDEPDC